MRVRTHILKSNKLHCLVELQYNDGLLSNLKMYFKEPLNADHYAMLMGKIPREESGLSALTGLGLKVVVERTAQQKIAMYCDKYMEHQNGKKYMATPTDGRRIKDYPVTYEILDAFFTSEHWKIKGQYTIHCLMANWNILLAEMDNAQKAKYPSTWSESYEAKLNDQGRKEYWAHLRGLGLVARKDRLGKTIDWVHENVLIERV